MSAQITLDTVIEITNFHNLNLNWSQDSKKTLYWLKAKTNFGRRDGIKQDREDWWCWGLYSKASGSFQADVKGIFPLETPPEIKEALYKGGHTYLLVDLLCRCPSVKQAQKDSFHVLASFVFPTKARTLFGGGGGSLSS